MDDSAGAGADLAADEEVEEEPLEGPDPLP